MRALSLAFLVAALSSCSVIIDTSADQCTSDSDCKSRGGAFASTICGPQKTCVFACTSNQECIDRVGGDAICHKDDGTCAALLSEDCKRVHYESKADLLRDPVVLGILLPVEGPNAASMVPPENAIELARREIMLNTGLPATTPGGSPRPLVFVTCTDDKDSTRAAKYLAETIRVPAIIGPAFSGVTTSVAQEVTIPDKVLIMSPSATSPTLTDIPDDGLVWRTCPSDTFQAVAMTGLIEKIVEPEVRTSYMLKDTDSIRLAVVHKGDAYGVGLANALFKGVRFNNKSAAENGDLYKQIDYGDPDKLSPGDATARRADAVSQILAFKPHILVEIGTAEGVTEVFAPIEQKWPGGEPIRARHVVSDGLQIPEIVTAINGNDALRKRVYGTIAGTTGGNFDTFRNAYKVAFKDGSTPDSYAASAYDAAYLLAFAVAGVGKNPITGKAIDAALHKVVIKPPKGITIDPGTDSVNKAFAAMLGDGIDYDGASGPLDFDVNKGEAAADIQVWCVGNTGKFIYTGYYYDAAKAQMSGAISCP